MPNGINAMMVMLVVMVMILTMMMVVMIINHPNINLMWPSIQHNIGVPLSKPFLLETCSTFSFSESHNTAQHQPCRRVKASSTQHFEHRLDKTKGQMLCTTHSRQADTVLAAYSDKEMRRLWIALNAPTTGLRYSFNASTCG
jgi:hypothetical protein